MTTILNVTLPPDGNNYNVPVGLLVEHPFSYYVNLDLLKTQLAAALPGLSLVVNAGEVAVEGVVYRVVIVGFDHAPTPSEQSTVDGKVTAHDPAQLTPEQQSLVDQGVDWAELRAQAVAMIEQGDNALVGIVANHTTLDSIATAVTAATTVPQLKAALAPLLTVQHAILNRQAGIITNFQRVLRALRWLVPSVNE